MDGRANRFRGIGRNAGQLCAERVRERDVRHNPAAEKRADAPFRPIEKLVGHEDVERPVFVLQAANRARRENPFDAEQLESENVRAEIQLGRQNPVPCAVAREKRHALSSKGADHVRTRRIAEWGRQRALFAVGQFGHVVQATAADDANSGMCHGAS